MRAAGRDHHMVDRTGQAVEESFQRRRISRVERGGTPRADVERCTLEPLGITAGEDDVGALRAGASGSLEADSGAAADHDNGLPDQFRLAGNGNTGGRGGHDSSGGWGRRPITGSPLAVADRLEADPLDARAPTGCHQQLVAPQLRTAVELQDILVAFPPRGGRVHPQHQLDSVPAQGLAERLAQPRRLARKHALGALDEHRLAAETSHDLRKLDAR